MRRWVGRSRPWSVRRVDDGTTVDVRQLAYRDRAAVFRLNRHRIARRNRQPGRLSRRRSWLSNLFANLTR